MPRLDSLMTKKNYFISFLPKNYCTVQKYQWNVASELSKPIPQSNLSQTQNNATESQNEFIWKKTWGSSSPTYNLLTPYQLKHGTNQPCHIQCLSINAFRWQIKIFKHSSEGFFAQWGITDFSQSQVRFKDGNALHLLPFLSIKHKAKVNLSNTLKQMKGLLTCLHTVLTPAYY